MTKVFVLGITGYIGGTIIEKLVKKHPELDVVAMVRTEAKGKKVTDALPKTRIVIGDLDSDEIISEESAKADIVLSTANCDHEGHIRAIYKGMAKHGGPSYLIHTSGTGLLADPTRSHPGLAKQSELSDREYDDLYDVSAITSLPDSNLHRLVDRLVLEHAPSNVKQLIVCPPLIYGTGTGPDNTGSIQLPKLVETTLIRKQAFTVSEGTASWSNVHIEDLGDLYVMLVEEALKEGGGRATWGPQGYYFAENGRHVWIELSKEIARVAKSKGLLDSEEVKQYTVEDVSKIHPWGAYAWGSNSKSIATRGRQQLGWKPHRASIFEWIPEEIEIARAKL